MIKSWRRATRLRKGLFLATLIIAAGILSGCKTVSFYAQAIKGQYEILARQEKVSKLLGNPATSAELRRQFRLVSELREFAEKQLALPVNGHYVKYAELHRPFVVWNMQAAPEFSMEPKLWWYPMLGRLEYRGYFSEKGATNYAAWLRDRGFDVHVGGVTAYSTLGWFKDPLLNTFIFEPDADLAETLFHELSHQRVFARGDTDFNEAFATAVGQEGTRRWLRAQRDTAAYDRYLTDLNRNTEFVRIVSQTRRKLEELYGDTRDEEGKVRAAKALPKHPESVRREKRLILEELRASYEQLKERWGDDTFRRQWFKNPINNAKLNSVANYYDLVPGFEELLAVNEGDLARFYEAVDKLSKKSKKERHEWLGVLAKSGEQRRNRRQSPPVQTKSL